MLNFNTTLKGRGSCYWQYFSGSGWQWVCPGQGGGNAPGGGNTLKGLGANTILTPAQISAMSIAALQNIIADHQRRIAEIDARVQYEQTLLYPWDDATKNLWLSEKNALIANIGAINAWINLPSKDKARTNGGQFIIKTKNSILQSLNKVTGNNDNTYENGSNIIDDTTDFLTSQYAGIPVWGIVLLAGAGIYVVSQNKKKVKRA